MDLRQIFLKIFDKKAFQEARARDYDSSHPFFKLFTDEIPRSLETIVGSFRSGKQNLFPSPYSFSGSIGKGMLADIFWFGVMDNKITNDPQKGVYVVYLVSYDGKRIYLSLIQAINGAIRSAFECEETIRKLKAARGGLIEKIDNRLASAPENYAEGFTKGPIDLFIVEGGNFFTAQAYQEATLYSKEYDCDNVPSEEDLRQDLWKMLKIYGQYRSSLNTVK